MAEISPVDVPEEITVFKPKKKLDSLLLLSSIQILFLTETRVKIFFIVWFSNIFALCLGNTFEEIIDLTYQASALSFLPMFFKKSQKNSKKLSIVAIKPVVGSDFNMPIRPRP